MKLLVCDKCYSVVQLRYKVRSCECGNIKGKYIDKSNIEVTVKDKKTSRILGLHNLVRYGLVKERNAWVIPFNNKTVTIKKEK